MMNRILTLGKKLLYRATDVILGIDIGTGAVKLAEVSSTEGKYILHSFGIVDLPENIIEDGFAANSEALTEIFKKLILHSGCLARDAVLAIGGRTVFVRELEFPAMSSAELCEAIKWDMEKYVPYEADTYYYDFAVTGQGRTPAVQKVLLAAIPKHIVDSVINVLEKVGLKLCGITIEPLAAYRTLAGTPDCLLIDVGATLSQITVFQKASPVLVRSIPVGGKKFTQIIMESFELEQPEAEQLKRNQKGLLPPSQGLVSPLYVELAVPISELAREIGKTVEYYQLQHQDAKLDVLYLTGGGASLDNFAQYLSGQLDAKIVMQDVLALVDVTPSLDTETIQKYANQLAVAIGLGICGDDIGAKINLLPPKKLTAIPWEKAALAAAVLFVGLLVSCFGYNAYQIWSAQQELKGLERQYALLQPTQEKMNRAKTTLQLIHAKNKLMVSLTKQNTSPYAFTARLGVVTPEGVQLTEVAASEKAGVVMRGQAASIPRVAAFIDNLAGDIYFSEPVLISVQEDTKQQTVIFEISAKLRGL